MDKRTKDDELRDIYDEELLDSKLDLEDGLDDEDEEEEKDGKKKIAIIILLLLLLGLMGTVAWFLLNHEDKTAIIVETDAELQDVDGTNQIRVKMNPTIEVAAGTMQNVDLCNLNAGRLLKMKIKVGDEYIYESQFIEEGQILQADVIDESKLQNGETEALAEIYSYSPDNEKEKIGQTNVEIVLVKE